MPPKIAIRSWPSTTAFTGYISKLALLRSVGRLGLTSATTRTCLKHGSLGAVLARNTSKLAALRWESMPPSSGIRPEAPGACE